MKKRFSRLAGSVAAMVLVSAMAAPVSAQSKALSQSYLVGTWKEDRACTGADAMAFDASGSAVVQGSQLNYSVTGPEQVTLSGNTGSLVLKMQYVDQNTMLAEFSGSKNALYRCGGASVSAASTTSAGTTTAVPQFTPTPAYIVGKWTDSGNCADTMTFQGNGEVLNNAGLPIGNWTLTGSMLQLALTSGTANFNVYGTDANSMTAINAATFFGDISHMKRCP